MMGRSCSARPRPWPNCRPNADSSSGKPSDCAVGQTLATVSVVTPGLMSAIEASIHSAGPDVGVGLRGRRHADVERPVIAGPVEHRFPGAMLCADLVSAHRRRSPAGSPRRRHERPVSVLSAPSARSASDPAMSSSWAFPPARAAHSPRRGRVGGLSFGVTGAA